MKILVLNHYERLSPRVEQEVHALLDQGFQVHVVFWMRKNLSIHYNTSISGKLTHEEINYSAPKGTLKLLIFLPGLYRRIIRKLKMQDFDVIHCTHIMLLPLAVFLGKQRRAKVIYDVYEFHLQETADRLPKLLRWLVPLLRKLEAWLVRRVDGVLTIDSASGQLEKYYRRYNNNVKVLYNVPDLPVYLEQEKLQQLSHRYQGKKIVLYIGGLSIAKGALQAIEVAELVVQKVPEALFLFIGMFHGKVETIFWKQVVSNELEKNVEFIPWLPYEELLYYVAISKVGLALHQPLPRYHMLGKGNGRKFFTYMQFGVPIVGPAFGEVGQIVREEGCGLLVDTTNPREVADAIIRLLESPQEARAMGERGRKAIHNRYNWDIEKEKLLSVYERALGKEIYEQSTQAQNPS